MGVNVVLNLGTNFKKIYLLGNFVWIDLFQFWTHFEKIYSLIDILSSDMLKLVLNIQEVDSPEHFVGINFSKFRSDLEEINLLPDLLWCFLRNVHKVDFLPHFLGCHLVRMTLIGIKVLMFMLFQQV